MQNCINDYKWHNFYVWIKEKDNTKTAIYILKTKQKRTEMYKTVHVHADHLDWTEENFIIFPRR